MGQNPSLLWRSRLKESQEHGKLFRGFDRMWQMGRHIQQIARFQRAWLAGKRKLAFAGQDVDESMLRGCVLGQLLALGKAEKNQPRRGGPKQCTAYNPVWSKLCF